MSIPDNVLTRYVHDSGYSWLTVLAEVPAGRHPLTAFDRDGLAAHFPRGPKASRFYLQVSTALRPYSELMAGTN